MTPFQEPAGGTRINQTEMKMTTNNVRIFKAATLSSSPIFAAPGNVSFGVPGGKDETRELATDEPATQF